MKKVRHSSRKKSRVGLKKIFKTIKYVYQQTSKNKLLIFLDIIHANLKYGATPTDYKNFLMYKKTEFENSTIITEGYNKDLIKKYNKLEYKKYLINQSLFYKSFSKYLERDWLELNKDNFKDFKIFCLEHSKIIAKYYDNSFEIIEIKKTKIKSLYNNLLKEKAIILEEFIEQNKKLNSLNSDYINNIKITTLLGKPIFAYLETSISENNKLIAVIDLETGKISHNAFDNNYHTYSKHPISHKKFIGLTIPKWEKIKEICESMFLEMPEISYIEWNLCIGKDKIHLLSAKEPKHEFFELPIINNDNIGLIPKISKIERGE